MKTLSSLRYLIMLLMLPLLLGSCSKEDADATPAVVQHKIQVRVTGESLSSLGAELHVKSTLNFIKGPYLTGPALNEAFSTSISKTYDLGAFGKEDIIEGLIVFKNVTRTSTTQPSAATRLKLEMIADGVVIESTELNKSGKGYKVDYYPNLTGEAAIETDNLK